MVTGIISVTLENLKKQAYEFGLERKDRTKFLTEEWTKLQDAKLVMEKSSFEKEVEKKTLGTKTIRVGSRAKTIRIGRKTTGKEKRDRRKTIGKIDERKTLRE